MRKSLNMSWRNQALKSGETNTSSSPSESSHSKQAFSRAVPWLKRLVAGLPPRRPGSIPGPSMWDLWWTKCRWGRFFPEYLDFSVNFIPTLLDYTEKKTNHLSLHLHHRIHHTPSGCGATVASAAGPFITKKKSILIIPCLLVAAGCSFECVCRHLDAIFCQSKPLSQRWYYHGPLLRLDSSASSASSRHSASVIQQARRAWATDCGSFATHVHLQHRTYEFSCFT